MLIQAALEWEAGSFRPDAMPSPDDLKRRNLLWRQDVIAVHKYLEWVRKAAEHPELFGSLDEALEST